MPLFVRYDTIFELGEAMTTMSHDRFTVGAAVSKGDPVEPETNPIKAIAQKEKFDPSPNDTNRAVAGAVVVAILQRATAGEVSVSAAAGKEMAAMAEMRALVDKALA
mmetsp:Transcript_6704/g.11955  ORF Transcript_6704/g.11955 Transcript_6704/m.11955 type:complete len:107 (+) Transcript_6704:906-1226(+)